MGCVFRMFGNKEHHYFRQNCAGGIELNGLDFMGLLNILTFLQQKQHTYTAHSI